jgi:imidazole glycerol-phosphate synthase subunit HisF
MLLIHEKGLVKTTKFTDNKYVGDPLNTVRIFNEKCVDEIIILDIDATVKGREPDFKMIESLASECRMPLCYGGGIKTVEQVIKILSLGVEKVSLSAAAIKNPNLIKEIVEKVGNQSIVVTLDVKRKRFGGFDVLIHNGTRSAKCSPVDLALKFQDLGAGEIVLNSIDNDGLMTGYDLKLIREVKRHMNLPMTLVGGCGTFQDVEALYSQEGLIGAAAGSFFVFKGKYRAVLITYPSEDVRLGLSNQFNSISST